MGSLRPETENRHSRRLPIGDVDQGELILADGSRWPVWILDQSAGGFGVATDRLPPVACGDIVEFHTEALLCEVRVARMSLPESDGESSEESSSTPEYRLGLNRLRDIHMPRHDHGHRGGRVRRHLSMGGVVQSPLAMFALVFGFVIVVSVGVGLLASRGSGQGSAADSQRDASGAVAQPGRSAPTELRTTESSRLPGALPFVMNGVARELNLSDAQASQIRQIIDDTNDAMRKNEQARLILENSRKRAVDVLNAEQRVRWESLIKPLTFD